MSTEDEVRKASREFYSGLNSMANGDGAPMARVWSHGANVTAMHPVGGREVGWEAVRRSFEQFAGMASDGKVELRDQRIQVSGDLAYETGVEQGQMKLSGHPIALEHRVTNIYQREAGGWKVVHHHTDVSPAILEGLSRVQSGSARAGR